MQSSLAEMLESEVYIYHQITSISKSESKFEDNKKPIEKRTHLPGDIFMSSAVKTRDREHQLSGPTAFDTNGGQVTFRSSKYSIAFCKTMAKDILTYFEHLDRDPQHADALEHDIDRIDPSQSQELGKLRPAADELIAIANSMQLSPL
eukprot:1680481-Heterocapsa_arctica.AAC.1